MWVVVGRCGAAISSVSTVIRVPWRPAGVESTMNCKARAIISAVPLQAAPQCGATELQHKLT